MPVDFARAWEEAPFKHAEKAKPALPRMEANGEAPIKKGIENTLEHGTYQCLMPPTGLEEIPETLGNIVTTDAGGGAGGFTSSDTSASASLSEITSSWQRLTSQQRD